MGALALIFVIQNTEQAPVEFLFWERRMSVWVAIAIAIALGIILDRLVPTWWRRRRRDDDAASARRSSRRRRPSPSTSWRRDAAGQPTLLVAHATGFHGRAYLPMAAHLADRYHVVATRLPRPRRHARPPDWPVDWNGYGDDAQAVGDDLAAARRRVDDWSASATRWAAPRC